MAASQKIQVKLLSEAAEYVTVTPVVQRDFSLAELVETMLPVLGKDAARIQQILRAGTLSTGVYRYRWQSLEAELLELERILEGFPGPEPSRIFQPQACFLVRFRRGIETLDLPRETASRKALFAPQSFWDALLDVMAKGVRYADYSHADRADVFTLAVDSEIAEQLHGLLDLLKPRSAAERLERFRPDQINWLTRR